MGAQDLPGGVEVPPAIASLDGRRVVGRSPRPSFVVAEADAEVAAGDDRVAVEWDRVHLGHG